MAATRSFSTSRHPPIADARALLERALERRAPLRSDGQTNAYRLVNGAADGLPGVAVDRLESVALLHLSRPVADEARLADAIMAVAGVESVYVRRHPPEAGRLSKEEVAALAPAEPLLGPARPRFPVIENGVRLAVRLDEGLSVGLFLDMREVRGWLRATAGGRGVLNLFAYTCAFGVCATLGGAKRVLNLDLSRPYLAWGKENYLLNGLPVDDHDFVYGDAFDWLGRFARRGEQFDVVILDPPSFSRSRAGRFSVERDYAALVQAAAAVVSAGGILIGATNHTGVSAQAFDAALRLGLQCAGRSGAPKRRWQAPHIDFPPLRGQHPTLKVRALLLD